jgi:hypothetical protein
MITPEHMTMAATEANLLQVEWSNAGYQLWKQETIQFPTSSTLTQGVGQYTLPATTIAVVMAYRQTGTAPNAINITMGPLSAYEWNALTNQSTQGPPTSYFFDRQITPVMNLWPVPDSGGPYTAFALVFQQIQDVVIPNGVTLDQPYRFWDAFTAGMAGRLAVHYAADRMQALDMAYKRAWELATTRDTASVPINIMPQLGRYWSP